MYLLSADLWTEDIHCTNWTLILYQPLSPCVSFGCGFIISVALTTTHFMPEFQTLTNAYLQLHILDPLTDMIYQLQVM